MAIVQKTNIGEIARMPDSTIEELRAKVEALIRALTEEIKYIEQRIT